MWIARGAIALAVTLGTLSYVAAPWTVARAAVSAAVCPATQPSSTTMPPSSIDPTERPAGSNWLWFGNQYLWTQLPPQGILTMSQIKQHPSAKYPWWRIASGRLSITGHPVARSKPHLTAVIPFGYGDDGFQATGLQFPSYGCWRVTGRVDGHTLSFVLKVVPPEHG